MESVPGVEARRMICTGETTKLRKLTFAKGVVDDQQACQIPVSKQHAARDRHP